MTRVLHVVEAMEAGVARHVGDLVQYVPAEHHVVLPSQRFGGLTDHDAYRRMADAGAVLHTIEMRRSVVDPRNAGAVRAVRRLIRQTTPAVVHGHASIGGAAARLGAAGTAAACVYTPNGLMPSVAVQTVERVLGRFTDRLVAVSATEAAEMRRLRIVPPERIVVIPNGIELQVPGPPSCDLREEIGVAPGSPLVGMVGRLVPQKAPEVFVGACARIAARHPAASFVLIGDGPLSASVDDEVDRAHLGGRFFHFRHLTAAPTIMSQLDVFALPSRYEGGPYAPLEAMRAGTAVVLTDVIGSRDTVEDGRSGLLVPPDDSQALADAVLRLLADDGLRHGVGEAGRARCAQCFDVREMATRVSRMYDSLMN